jgi:hypothetical protein
MYSTRSGLIFGFHGCDESVVNEVVNRKIDLRESQNNYDWLGHGIYFWENSPERALEYATFLKENPERAKNPIIHPSVIGAVIDLGVCFDLIDYNMLKLLKNGYDLFNTVLQNTGRKLPINKTAGHSSDLLMRELDCAVIESIHDFRKEKSFTPFDSVRGVFWEGGELYPNAGFREKDHIQICVRNPNCIKGYFIPRELDITFSPV